MNRRERRAAGQKLKTASSGAKTPAAWCEQGHRHLEADRVLDAQLCCQQALVADSNCAEAWYLMGLLSLRAGQIDHAIALFSRAVQLVAEPRYFLSLGHALKRHGRIEDAFRAFDKAVELDIDSAAAWKPLAQILADLNRRDEAALAFQQVLKLDPRDADAAYQAGFLLFHAGKPEAALATLDQADRLRGDHAPTLQTRALAMSSVGRFEEAVAELARAHALVGDDPDTCNNMGVFLRRLGRYEEALSWFDKALKLRPDAKTAHNKAYALERLHRFDEALAIYAEVKAADPDNAEADLNTALLQLSRGNFAAGWAGREARWKVAAGVSVARYDFAQPMWRGEEPIDGKTILIYQDEGLGDVIQFARYVPMVAALGARVILVVDDALVPLLSNLPAVAECVSRAVRRNVSFDNHCAITSLALAFNTRLETIPSDVPYLPVPTEQRRQTWERRLGPHDKMRIGLVWSGHARHHDDHNRSIALQALSPLSDLDAIFVSLQKDLRPEDQVTLSAQTGIVDLTAHLTNFVETAALISCLDLVISVDTSMAHLAGALACPTWILLPHTPDWRWLLDRDDSPWYPTARLFRQREPGNYADVIERVRTELGARILAWSANAPVTIDHVDPATSEDAVAELLSLGHALKRQGRIEEAFRAFDKAVELDIDSAEAWKPLAQMLAEFKRLEEATRAFQHVCKLDPQDADAAYQAGLLLLQAGKPEEALTFFDRSDRLQPNRVATLQMRALALLKLVRLHEAVAEIGRAHALDPENADICDNMGVFLRRSGRPQESLAWFDRALKLRPDFSAASNNKVSALVDLSRCDEALAICLKVMAADPKNAEAEFNMGFLQLLKGNFEAGWARREARWRMPPSQAPIRYDFSQPLWLGKEPIAGKSILIHQDEGLGDTIQFARYVPMLAKLGARVILLVADALVPLLSKLEGVAECVARSADHYVSFDMYCPITTLPLAFGTRLETIPSATPFLPAPDASRVQAWEQRLGPRTKLRVGLVWSGNPQQANDHNRSTTLRTLLPLLDLDATFVSLQKDPRPDDRALLAQTPIVDLTAQLTDFAETAALVSCLDLVISVCTSMAHLSGALACPTWILLQYAPDWRWLLDRDDSPWYPTARLFRQDETRDYAGVIERLRSELRARVAAWPPEHTAD